LPANRVRDDAFFRDSDRQNHSAVIETELVDAHDAMIPIRLTQRPTMVDDVPVS
jgi:hypothetical protein